ncbi:MAG: DAK2 domain-containing protein [Anaerolineaceae bacterium]
MSSNLQFSSSSSESRVTTLVLLDGQDLKVLIEAALTWIKTNQQTVNALNVFPVPDGDTGTNMLLTMQAAFNEIQNSGERNIGKMAHAIAQGALLGARGNSGVILSQLWRGFARALDNLEKMDALIFVNALKEARVTAYKGVVRPVEGTILTVAKDISIAAENSTTKTDDIMQMLDYIVTEADLSVQRTPDLLPILKQAGVVDAGGKGLFYLFEGMLRFLKGQSLESAEVSIKPLSAINLDSTLEKIEPGQDFEWVIDFRPSERLDSNKFYNDLSKIGTSIQIGEGDGMYRMHIHVSNQNRDLPLDYVSKLGTILNWTGENLVAQMEEQQSASQPVKFNLASVNPGQIGVVVVSPGVGISRIFASLGASAIIEGGQTMNPSTEEIVKAFENLHTDKIIILPNNKNIILAAQAAATVTLKKATVVPSKSIPQGLSAMLRLEPDGDLEHIVADMIKALQDVETGEVTVATRSVEINGVHVEAGQVIALLNGDLVEAASTLDDACLGLLKKANTSDRERITLFYGENISRNEVNRIVDNIRAAYPSHEIELHEGGQPHYQFIISIE